VPPRSLRSGNAAPVKFVSGLVRRQASKATTIRPTPTWWSLLTAFSLMYGEFPAN
jgi:hypothetical protein